MPFALIESPAAGRGPLGARRLRPWRLALVCLLTAVPAALSHTVPLMAAQIVPTSPSPDGAPPAFPGAAGFGSRTSGGRGGPVVAVTSLADEGPGTLRWALEVLEGPRIVIFAVSGEIALGRQISVNGQVTVFGQVAPDEGVVITGSRLRVVGDDVILQGLRIRPGDGPGQDKTARDAISVGTRERPVRRVVIDGNSLTWATDENAAVLYDAGDVTVSNNIIAEALHRTGRPDGPHSMGLLVSRGAERVSVHDNLIASNWSRNPQIARAESVEIVNNLVVNPVIGGIEINRTPASIDAINNVLIAGPDTHHPEERPLIAIQVDDPALRVFLSGNRTPLGEDVTRGPGAERRAASRTTPDSGLQPRPAAEVRDHVLARAGARYPALDPVDSRIVAAAAEGGGHLIDSPRDVGGLPAMVRPGVEPPDTDADGVPDAVEKELGSDPLAVDSYRIAANSSYAFIELYAHRLVRLGETR